MYYDVTNVAIVFFTVKFWQKIFTVFFFTVNLIDFCIYNCLYYVNNENLSAHIKKLVLINGS